VPGYGSVIRVVILEAQRGLARVGIDAPREVSVARGESGVPPAAPSYGKAVEQE
jgi:hypothetical protein